VKHCTTVLFYVPFLPHKPDYTVLVSKVKGEKGIMFKSILIAGILVAVGFIVPSVSLPVWGLALFFLAWGLKDVIPYPKNNDSDYVDRYFKAKEDARLNTKAYLHQARLHKDEIAQLNKMINKDS
jgi:hypothetical protein